MNVWWYIAIILVGGIGLTLYAYFKKNDLLLWRIVVGAFILTVFVWGVNIWLKW